MGKLLDLTGRLEQGKSSPSKGNIKSHDLAPTVDISDLRQEALREDRRKVKRTILTEFISVHAVVPGFGLLKVNLYDINNQGLSFDLDQSRGAFKIGEEIALRVYLNHQTYFGFVLQVKHVNEVTDEAVWRHGGSYVAGTINDVALQHFVSFMENVSASLRHDSGDVIVSKIL